MAAILGVDIGNSKTVALLAGPDGALLGYGRGGCGDIYAAPLVAGRIVAADVAIGAALAMAGLAPQQIVASAFSAAGADWAEDIATIELAVRGYGPPPLVVNDALGALRAGAPDGTGVAVVCGTGVGTGARSAAGAQWHSSFWQIPQGGHALGKLALEAVFRAELGAGPATALTARILGFHDLPTVEALLYRYNNRREAPPNPRHLARLLLDTAATGDGVANAIVINHGADLGRYALAAARQVGIDGAPFWLVLAGGIFRHPAPHLADALIAQVRSEAPLVRPVRPRFEPAVGALLLGFERTGVTIDDALLGRLERELPPDALFAT